MHGTDDSDGEVQEARRLGLEHLRMEYGEVFMDILDVLSRHDPMGLMSAGAPPGEYEPEVRTIYPRLQTARSVDDVRQIVQEEFRRWFSSPATDQATVATSIAQDIWKAWEGHS